MKARIAALIAKAPPRAKRTKPESAKAYSIIWRADHAEELREYGVMWRRQKGIPTLAEYRLLHPPAPSSCISCKATFLTRYLFTSHPCETRRRQRVYKARLRNNYHEFEGPDGVHFSASHPSQLSQAQLPKEPSPITGQFLA
jgi:hypothetical protein